jgi:hypothetical protein
MSRANSLTEACEGLLERLEPLGVANTSGDGLNSTSWRTRKISKTSSMLIALATTLGRGVLWTRPSCPSARDASPTVLRDTRKASRALITAMRRRVRLR